MKNIIIIISIFISSITIGQNNVELSSSSDLFNKNYLRPGLSIITINHKNISGLDKLNINNVIPQFDIIELEKDEFEIDYNLDGLDIDNNPDEFIDYKLSLNSVVENIVSQKVAGQHFYSSLSDPTGKFDNNKIRERAKYSLTEDQLKNFSNLSGSSIEDIATSRLLNQILEKNYVLVIVPYNYTNEDGIFKSKYWSYVFKIDISEGSDIVAKRNVFSSKYDFQNLNELKVDPFPTNLLYSGGGESSSVYADNSSLLGSFFKKGKEESVKSAEELKQILDENIISSAISSSSKEIDAFKPRSILGKNMLVSLGSKEGLKIDDRFISYEYQLGPDGVSSVLVKKGVDRVKKVADNNFYLKQGEELPKSKLYGDSGKRSKESYLSVLDNDYKLGVSISYKDNIGVSIDYRTQLVPNLFVVLDVEKSLWEFNDTIYGIPVDVEYDGYLVMGGLQKNFNIGRKLAIAPYFQVGTSIYNDDDGESIDELQGFASAFGLKIPIKIGSSLQIIPEIQFRSTANAELNVIDNGFYQTYDFLPTDTESKTIPSISVRYNL